MALTLGILLNLTFGMVEFGYYFYVRNMLCDAAREGARAAIVPGAQNSDVTAAVNNTLGTCKFPAGSVTTSITDTSGNALTVSSTSGGTPIQVSVTATWGAIGVGFRPLNLISAAKSVAGACVMRKE